MTSTVRLTRRGSALAAGVFVCTLAALPGSASARQVDHAVPVAAGDIRLHGHWEIDVRNPDGTLVARREFDNALTRDGARHLTNVLLRLGTPSRTWAIQLGSDLADGPCEGINFGILGFDNCYVIDVAYATSPYNGQAGFPTLIKNLGGPGQTQLILAGSFTVRTAGQIDRVATIQQGCPTSFSPEGCLSVGGGAAFTRHHFRDAQGAAAPIPVAAGQIVQVTVTFSFCGSEGCQS